MMREPKKEQPRWQNRNAARCIMRHFYRIFKCVVPLSQLRFGSEGRAPRRNWKAQKVTDMMCDQMLLPLRPMSQPARWSAACLDWRTAWNIQTAEAPPPFPLHCFTATWMRNYPACCMLEHTRCCLISGATADGGVINGSGILEIKMSNCSKGI